MSQQVSAANLCVEIGFFNWTDADDLSPVSFVEREMRTKWCGCFSEADVQNDLAALKEMKFLKEANISVEGSGNVRSVSVHLRGQAIPIADVRVRGYGLLEGLKESEIPPLTIHTGDSYSNSAIRNLERILEKSFAKDGRQVQVFSDVQVSAKGEASLNFGVLAYPDDFVYVNGSPFDSTDHEPVTLVSSIHQ
jgi:outer membrane protein assembly factor BamA